MDGWDRDGVPKDDSIPPSGRRRWSSTLSLRGSTLLRSMERRLLLPLDSNVGPIVDVDGVVYYAVRMMDGCTEYLRYCCQ